MLQCLVTWNTSNAPLEKLRAVAVPNPRMRRVLEWYINSVPGATFPREMLDSWSQMIPEEKRRQWEKDALEYDVES